MRRWIVGAVSVVAVVALALLAFDIWAKATGFGLGL